MNRSLLAHCSIITLAAIAIPAHAQTGVAEAPTDDIIVTARKRDETSLAVPLAISAVGGAELARRGITKLDDLGKVVPQLQIGESNGGIQGGTITLRGIGSGDTSGLVEQAVSFVIDGAPVQRVSVRRMSELDIQQIEVLKGPQALFYGKNSPGGIISIRTADPTEDLAAGLRASYGFNAREAKVSGFVAGPITGNLGIRGAFYGSRVGGDQRNTVPKSNPLRSRGHLPYDREYGGRITLKWEPTPEFDARFKFNYGRTRNEGVLQNAQLVFCALGSVNQFNIPEADCTPDDRIYNLDTGTVATSRQYRFGNGKNDFLQHQILTSLELGYKPTDQLSLTSITSLYKVNFDYHETVSLNGLIVATGVDIRDFGQELRLQSDFDMPVNFTLGGYYANTKGDAFSDVFVGAVSSIGQDTFVKGESYSVFAQGTWNILQTLELAGGARYSHEHKSAKVFGRRDPGIFDVPVRVTPSERSFHNISPEATLTWRPTRNFTLYGGYRQGFLSGGFSAAPTAALDRSYNQQKTKGFEGGLKALLFDNSLRFNLAAYRYVTTGLQVSIGFTDPQGVVSLQTVNAGKSTSEGLEADFSWKTPAEGLSLHSALAYNRSRYNKFTALCYRGQTPAQGCNLVQNASGAFTLQDLKGQQVVRAPDWVVNFGANYEMPLSQALKLAISGDAAYSDNFFTESRNIPGSLQPSYWQVDAGVRLIQEGQGWELALLGKNLTNEYFFIRTSEASGTGTVAGRPTGTVSDLIGAVNRGREVVLQASVKFGSR
ncbi:TonB-dependent receptor [Rhizorhabdus argentea]|uniref:TonB-dependent receptor n=1 Tax=Rhizorhabdus argentea TaxID=1387174 RepID=UPI0030EB51A2